MVAVAWAQTGAESAGPPAIYNIGFILLMVAIFYFVLLRPEQRRRKEHEQLVGGVKRNDQVIMGSGMHGRVMAVAERTVTVEIAPKVQVLFEKTAIQTVVGADGAGETRDKEKA
ncbi:MAG: preprotein translocase subunit YajC [bacterium]|nr:preprotein translocase subunit YajC [bacterium]